MDDEQLTIEEAANLLNVGVETVRRWIDRGLPAAQESGGRVVIARSDLRQFLEREGQGAPRDAATEF
jgi:excisionase family DNA binding protein